MSPFCSRTLHRSLTPRGSGGVGEVHLDDSGVEEDNFPYSDLDLTDLDEMLKDWCLDEYAQQSSLDHPQTRDLRSCSGAKAAHDGERHNT